MSSPLCALYVHTTLADVEPLHGGSVASLADVHALPAATALPCRGAAYSCMVTYAEYSALHTRYSRLHWCRARDGGVDALWRRLCCVVVEYAARHGVRDVCARDRRMGASTLHLTGAFVWRTSAAATSTRAALCNNNNNKNNNNNNNNNNDDDNDDVYVFGLVTQCATRAQRVSLCTRACATLPPYTPRDVDATLPLVQALRRVRVSLTWTPSQQRVTPRTILPRLTARVTYDGATTAAVAKTTLQLLRMYMHARLFLCKPVDTTLGGVCTRALLASHASDNNNNKHSRSRDMGVVVATAVFDDVFVCVTGEFLIAVEVAVRLPYRPFVPALYDSIRPFRVVDHPDA